MMLKILSGVLGISLCLQNFQGLDQVPMTFKTSEHEPTKCQWKVIRFSYAFEDVRYCVCQILLRDHIICIRRCFTQFLGFRTCFLIHLQDFKQLIYIYI